MTRGARRPHPWSRIGWLLLAGLLLAVSFAHAADVDVRAFLDRDQAQLGDTVTLNIEVDGSATASAPDVSRLSSDFDILGRSHSTRIRIANGQRSVQTLWAIQLRPRRAGTFTIPPLQVDGQSTAPLTLTVGAAPTTSLGKAGDPVFLRVGADTLTPYVGQQVTLTVRLFYAPDIQSGSLDMPQASGVDLRQLGQPSRYQVQRDGRFYQVLEKRYALIARHAGALDLAPVTFRGKAADPGSFARFFGQGRPVEARSKGLHLAVRARPSGSGKGAWLPARKLSLTLTGWPPGGRVEVGQPVTLTLEEKAVGLPFESLPKLAWPATQGVQVYPDQAHRQTDADGRWLVGTRTRQFVLVAQQPGRVTIPAITLSWWNVEAGKAEVARIPSRVLQVTAAAGASTQVPPAAGSSAPAPASSPPDTAAPAASQAGRSPASHGSGHVLAWAASGLWLATLLLAGGWWWWRRRRRARATTAPAPAPAAAPTPNRRRLHQAFRQAARDGDVAAQCDSLLAWARGERPSLQHLGELAQSLRPGAQTEAVAALQRARYAAAAQGPDARTLLDAFDAGFAWRDEPSGSTPGPALPPLYPPEP